MVKYIGLHVRVLGPLIDAPKAKGMSQNKRCTRTPHHPAAMDGDRTLEGILCPCALLARRAGILVVAYFILIVILFKDRARAKYH